MLQARDRILLGALVIFSVLPDFSGRSKVTGIVRYMDSKNAVGKKTVHISFAQLPYRVQYSTVYVQGLHMYLKT